MSIIVNPDRRVRDLLTQIKEIYPSLIDDLKAARPTSNASSLLETIIESEGRPVLPIRDDDIQIDTRGMWHDVVEAAREPLRQAVRAVGRVHVSNHPAFEWLGTGWLVADDVIVTARHVAAEFVRRTGESLVFRSTSSGTVGASIDFLQEAQNPQAREVPITDILHVEESDGPDLSFLRVRNDRNPLARPIPLRVHLVEPGDYVGVVGYAGRDSRIPDEKLMEELFGRVWEKKHLSPGLVLAATPTSIEHDCSTVGGSAGAPLLDLRTGEAVGLNFAGQYLKANYAVPASLIAHRLQEIRLGRPRALPAPKLELSQSSQYVGDDQWNWTVWLEGSAAQLDGVESVEYTLHPTFPKPVRLIQDRSTKFRLESSGWGAFLLRAKINRKDGSVIPASLTLKLDHPLKENGPKS